MTVINVYTNKDRTGSCEFLACKESAVSCSISPRPSTSFLFGTTEAPAFPNRRPVPFVSFIHELCPHRPTSLFRTPLCESSRVSLATFSLHVFLFLLFSSYSIFLRPSIFFHHAPCASLPFLPPYHVGFDVPLSFFSHSRPFPPFLSHFSLLKLSLLTHSNFPTFIFPFSSPTTSPSVFLTLLSIPLLKYSTSPRSSFFYRGFLAFLYLPLTYSLRKLPFPISSFIPFHVYFLLLPFRFLLSLSANMFNIPFTLPHCHLS